jgi:hypothetical protein
MSRSTRCAVAALVLAVPVLAEVARPATFDTVAGHLLFAALQALGWVLLATVVRGAPAHARESSRRGHAMVLLSCALQILFAVAYGATALDGEPFEAVFVLFLLGFIALLVGGPVWAWRLRRLPGGRPAATGLLAVAVLGALAIAVEADPFHDIALVGSYLAWVLVGRGLTVLEAAAPGGRSADRTSPRRAEARH